ncbi:hypothetical protein CCHR01_15368 [Colletotrichum chrysophilum]|uniref:Uncharacterized protein n=1 Tax=Colletotrichum chrysophilum TaxID=1836956 RepID=A0AAD9A5T7_9PEZI|nr:hypothetical protein CCHR01_15368 [Colletotrichum chrysophilum]
MSLRGNVESTAGDGADARNRTRGNKTVGFKCARAREWFSEFEKESETCRRRWRRRQGRRRVRFGAGDKRVCGKRHYTAANWRVESGLCLMRRCGRCGAVRCGQVGWSFGGSGCFFFSCLGGLAFFSDGCLLVLQTVARECVT